MHRPGCAQARRPYRIMGLTLGVIAVSTLASILLAQALLSGRPVIVVSAAVLLMAAIFSIVTVREFRRQARVLEGLCGECRGSLVYVPRRLVYACRARGGGLLCFSTANGRILRVQPAEEISRHEFDPWRDPADFYCAKPLEGRLEKRNGRAVFEGVFLYVDPYGPSIVRARGRVVSERAY